MTPAAVTKLMVVRFTALVVHRVTMFAIGSESQLFFTVYTFIVAINVNMCLSVIYTEIKTA